MFVMSTPQLETEVTPGNPENAPEAPRLSYPPAAVDAIGVLRDAVGWSSFLEVGFYNRVGLDCNSYLKMD